MLICLLTFENQLKTTERCALVIHEEKGNMILMRLRSL